MIFWILHCLLAFALLRILHWILDTALDTALDTGYCIGYCIWILDTALDTALLTSSCSSKGIGCTRCYPSYRCTFGNGRQSTGKIIPTDLENSLMHRATHQTQTWRAGEAKAPSIIYFASKTYLLKDCASVLGNPV